MNITESLPSDKLPRSACLCLAILSRKQLLKVKSNRKQHLTIFASISYQAHCHQFVVEQFANVIRNESFSATLRPVMEALFRLYCVHGIVEQAKDFLEVKFYLNEIWQLIRHIKMTS
jgi:hypothetical protein